MIQIDIDKCIGCKACEKDCPGRAIKVTDGKAEYAKKCILCGHCVAICPQNAVSIPDYDMEDMEEYDPQTFHVDPKAFLHAVKFRRSIRNFTEKPIPRHTLERTAGLFLCRTVWKNSGLWSGRRCRAFWSI